MLLFSNKLYLEGHSFSLSDGVKAEIMQCTEEKIYVIKEKAITNAGTSSVTLVFVFATCCFIIFCSVKK